MKTKSYFIILLIILIIIPNLKAQNAFFYAYYNNTNQEFNSDMYSAIASDDNQYAITSKVGKEVNQTFIFRINNLERVDNINLLWTGKLGIITKEPVDFYAEIEVWNPSTNDWETKKNINNYFLLKKYINENEKTYTLNDQNNKIIFRWNNISKSYLKNNKLKIRIKAYTKLFNIVLFTNYINLSFRYRYYIYYYLITEYYRYKKGKYDYNNSYPDNFRAYYDIDDTTTNENPKDINKEFSDSMYHGIRYEYDDYWCLTKVGGSSDVAQQMFKFKIELEYINSESQRTNTETYYNNYYLNSNNRNIYFKSDENKNEHNRVEDKNINSITIHWTGNISYHQPYQHGHTECIQIWNFNNNNWDKKRYTGSHSGTANGFNALGSYDRSGFNNFQNNREAKEVTPNQWWVVHKTVGWSNKVCTIEKTLYNVKNYINENGEIFIMVWGQNSHYAGLCTDYISITIR